MRSKFLATLAGASLVSGAVLALAPSASATPHIDPAKLCERLSDDKPLGLKTVTTLSADPASPASVGSSTDKVSVDFTAKTVPADITDDTDLSAGPLHFFVDGADAGASNPNTDKLLPGNHEVVAFFGPAKVQDNKDQAPRWYAASCAVLDYVVQIVVTTPGPTVTDTATATVTATETKTVTVSGGSSGPGFTG